MIIGSFTAAVYGEKLRCTSSFYKAFKIHYQKQLIKIKEGLEKENEQKLRREKTAKLRALRLARDAISEN